MYLSFALFKCCGLNIAGHRGEVGGLAGGPAEGTSTGVAGFIGQEGGREGPEGGRGAEDAGHGRIHGEHSDLGCGGALVAARSTCASYSSYSRHFGEYIYMVVEVI
jgi:hypothetical protein